MWSWGCQLRGYSCERSNFGLKSRAQGHSDNLNQTSSHLKVRLSSFTLWSRENFQTDWQQKNSSAITGRDQKWSQCIFHIIPVIQTNCIWRYFMQLHHFMVRSDRMLAKISFNLMRKCATLYLESLHKTLRDWAGLCITVANRNWAGWK